MKICWNNLEGMKLTVNCKGCHYKYGHQDECNTGVISNKIC